MRGTTYPVCANIRGRREEVSENRDRNKSVCSSSEGEDDQSIQISEVAWQFWLLFSPRGKEARKSFAPRCFFFFFFQGGRESRQVHGTHKIGGSLLGGSGSVRGTRYLPTSLGWLRYWAQHETKFSYSTGSGRTRRHSKQSGEKTSHITGSAFGALHVTTRVISRDQRVEGPGLAVGWSRAWRHSMFLNGRVYAQMWGHHGEKTNLIGCLPV